MGNCFKCFHCFTFNMIFSLFILSTSTFLLFLWLFVANFFSFLNYLDIQYQEKK